MSKAGEATVNPDGSTTFNTTMGEDDAFTNSTTNSTSDAFGTAPIKQTDPAVFLLVLVLVIGVLWYFLYYRKRQLENQDDFFSNLDGEKFNLKLPTAVDEYYTIKEQCLKAGWEPGQNTTPASGPQKVLAQALMKRCIADIPIVTHIQKESAGMNKLYSQSMCSVKQWRAYQNAEALVSAEVDEVRVEADEIEPGWSQVIWRQAMQYHNMLKQKHEMEQKAASDAAKKKREEEEKESAEKKKEEEERARALAAEKAAEELIKMEEREQQSKKAFSSSSSGSGAAATTMKKGFLNSTNKKKGTGKTATTAATATTTSSSSSKAP